MTKTRLLVLGLTLPLLFTSAAYAVSDDDVYNLAASYQSGASVDPLDLNLTFDTGNVASFVGSPTSDIVPLTAENNTLNVSNLSRSQGGDPPPILDGNIPVLYPHDPVIDIDNIDVPIEGGDMCSHCQGPPQVIEVGPPLFEEPPPLVMEMPPGD